MYVIFSAEKFSLFLNFVRLQKKEEKKKTTRDRKKKHPNNILNIIAFIKLYRLNARDGSNVGRD